MQRNVLQETMNKIKIKIVDRHKAEIYLYATDTHTRRHWHL